MRLGICAEIGDIRRVKDAGFDYIELCFRDLYETESEALLYAAQSMDAAGIKSEAMNGMLPGRFTLCQSPEMIGQAVDFCADCFRKAKLLGTQVVVFGSAGARNIPPDMQKAEAVEKLCIFLRSAAHEAALLGIDIAIEPLNRKESNIINSVGEALELAEDVGAENVGVLADYYHMAEEHEDEMGILAAGDRLLHCHLANAGARLWPQSGDGIRYTMFTNALPAINYRGRISIEGSGLEGMTYKSAALRMRELFYA